MLYLVRCHGESRRNDDGIAMNAVVSSSSSRVYTDRVLLLQASLAQGHRCVISQGKRSLGLPVGYQLDSPEQASATDVAHVRMVGQVVLEEFLQETSHVLHVVEEVVFLNDLLDLECRCAAGWVALEGVAVDEDTVMEGQ